MTQTDYDGELLEAVAAGKSALFLGAGFSIAVGTPRPRDKAGLKGFLIDAFRQSLGKVPYDLESMTMEDVVLYLESAAGVARPAIEDAIRRFLGTSSELVTLESFSLLRTLVERRPDLLDVIVTTNWDAGIETSLAGLPLKINVVAMDTDTAAIERGQLTLFKIHGDITRASPNLVISSADFDLYEREHPLLIERLRSVLASRFIVLLGYSGRDDNFRRLLRYLSYDLHGQFRGGWIVCPELAPRESLWTSQVKLRHVASSAQDFLRAVLVYSTTDLWGSSPQGVRKRGQRSILVSTLTPEKKLDRIATKIRNLFGLRKVWVLQPRSPSIDANQRIENALACLIEDASLNARSISLSTGRTVEYACDRLDMRHCRHIVALYSTIVLLNGTGAFRDPISVVDVMASKFPIGRCVAHGIRISGLDSENIAPEAMDILRTTAANLVEEAVHADLLVGSVRPPEWFGSESNRSHYVQGRTQPFNMLFRAAPRIVQKAFEDAGVVAVHQMIPLNQDGEDVSQELVGRLGEPIAEVFRPTTSQLREASQSDHLVVLPASHRAKAQSVLAVLRGRLCNTLVIDYDLAEELLG